MAKNLGSMLGGLGQGLMGKVGDAMPMSGAGLAGNPLSGIGVLKGLMGGGGGDEEPNPGQKMFGMTNANPASGMQGKKGFEGFMSRFGDNMQEMLFQKAMQGFMGHMQ